MTSREYRYFKDKKWMCQIRRAFREKTTFVDNTTFIPLHIWGSVKEIILNELV